jgi:guanine nucleotide-binding protein subunit alpha
MPLFLQAGQVKCERRNWIRIFSDVTVVIFTVSLSGYDRCLMKDRDAVCRSFSRSLLLVDSRLQNQMQDLMTIWDSICHSKWFSQNQMQVSMTTWDSICHSKWFKGTPIVWSSSSL